VLRFEVWRQFGALLDELEKKYDADDLLDYALEKIVASQIQQRERLYDLADQRMINIIDQVLTANVRGPFATICAFVPLLRESGDGVIVNISSGAAQSGTGSSIIYGSECLGDADAVNGSP